MIVYRYLVAIVSTVLLGAIKSAEGIKCHPYNRVCILNCKKTHGGNVFMRNMCIGGCKFSQCVLKRKDILSVSSGCVGVFLVQAWKDADA